jgi:L-cystine transport system substrate-binding protein
LAVLGLSATLVAGLMVGCGSDKKASDKVTTIAVGTQNDYPPFAYADKSGELTGYDVDVIKAIDKKLKGYKFTFQALPWESIFLSLESNKIQVIADEIAKTPEREKKYLFTDENYFSAQTVIVVKKGTKGIESLKDLEGKRVAAVAGDSYTGILEDYNKKNGNKIILKYSENSSPDTILQDVQNGRVDAYVNDPIMINATIKKNNLDLEVVGSPVTIDNIALTFNKDKTGKELKAAIDPVIKELKKDGTLAKLSKKWTGGEYIPQ